MQICGRVALAIADSNSLSNVFVQVCVVASLSSRPLTGTDIDTF